MRVHAAKVFLAAGTIIAVMALWLLVTGKTVTGYTGPGIAKAPANRIDTFNACGLLLLAAGCFYCGWTLIKKDAAP
jgi:hypothetical protein